MKKQEIFKKCSSIADTMFENTFLIPSKHTGRLQCSNLQATYEIYCNDERTYLSIIFKEGVETFAFSIFKRSSVTMDFDPKVKSCFESKSPAFYINKIEYILDIIYNEIHCLNYNNLELKKIRTEINLKKESIESTKKELKQLEQRIEHSNLK